MLTYDARKLKHKIVTVLTDRLLALLWYTCGVHKDTPRLECLKFYLSIHICVYYALYGHGY